MPHARAERKRVDQLDVQLNRLYAISSDLELAKIKGQQARAKTLLADGLARSCQLLRRLQEDEVLKTATLSNTIRTLADQKVLLERFLKVEHDLLGETKLDREVTNFLLGKLRSLLTSGESLPANWKRDLELLTGLVCPEAKKAAAAPWKPSLVKRTIVAGGGALLAILNLVPPGVQIAAPVVALSTSAGTWLISEAFRDQLNAFFGD